MGKTKTITKSFSQLTKEGLEATRKKLIADTKKQNSYLVVADKRGKAKRLSAASLK